MFTAFISFDMSSLNNNTFNKYLTRLESRSKRIKLERLRGKKMNMNGNVGAFDKDLDQSDVWDVSVSQHKV